MDDRYNRNQILPRDWLSSPIQERYPTPAAYTTTIRSATAQTRYLRLEHPLEACAAMHGHIYTLLTDQSYITRTGKSIRSSLTQETRLHFLSPSPTHSKRLRKLNLRANIYCPDANERVAPFL